jgi:hypothetical protein
LIHPFRTSFNVTPKDGIDDGGWQAARQLRLVLAMAAVIVAAVVVRCLALGGIAPLPPLPVLAVVAGLAFGVWELVMVTAALTRVTRRRQVRHHFRVPIEVAGVVDGSLVRVVDLTPGGAGVIGPSALEVGTEVGLHLDLPTVSGEVRTVRVRFTVCSCRPAKGLGWRMGGTLTPVTDADGEALIEHCHVVSSRTRLAQSGRLLPGPPVDVGPVSAVDHLEPPARAHA